MAPKPLTTEERDALESGLNLAAAMAGGARPLSVAQVQGLYDDFLGKDVVAEAVSVLGLAFGELLMPLGPFDWVRVIDDHGASETCVGVVGAELFCYPISMIETRLKAGEAVEIEVLARQTAMELKKLHESGAAKERSVP